MKDGSAARDEWNGMEYIKGLRVLGNQRLSDGCCGSRTAVGAAGFGAGVMSR